MLFHIFHLVIYKYCNDDFFLYSLFCLFRFCSDSIFIKHIWNCLLDIVLLGLSSFLHEEIHLDVEFRANYFSLKIVYCDNTYKQNKYVLSDNTMWIHSRRQIFILFLLSIGSINLNHWVWNETIFSIFLSKS